MFVFSDSGATNFPPVFCAHSPFGGNFRPQGSQHNRLVYFIYSYILICHFNFRSPNLFVFIMICLYFALLVTFMSDKENDCKYDQKTVLFAAIARKPVPHWTENQIKARTKLLSNSVLANTLTVNFFYACFSRFPSSMELWAKGSNLHTQHITMLLTSTYMSNFALWRTQRLLWELVS